jgi:hypothetical protein
MAALDDRSAGGCLFHRGGASSSQHSRRAIDAVLLGRLARTRVLTGREEEAVARRICGRPGGRPERRAVRCGGERGGLLVLLLAARVDIQELVVCVLLMLLLLLLLLEMAADHASVAEWRKGLELSDQLTVIAAAAAAAVLIARHGL